MDHFIKFTQFQLLSTNKFIITHRIRYLFLLLMVLKFNPLKEIFHNLHYLIPRIADLPLRLAIQ